MRFMFSLPAAVAAASLFLGCGNTEEVSQSDLQALASSPSVATATATPSPTPPASATPTPTPAPTPLLDAWTTYVDPVEGFSIKTPPGPAPDEEIVEFAERVNFSALTGRSVLFTTKSGNPAVSMVVAPNPAQLTLAQWIETYPGWPSDPTEITVAGEAGLLFPLDVLGHENPTVYFKRGGKIFGIKGNVVGGEGVPPGLTGLEFDQIIAEFDFL